MSIPKERLFITAKDVEVITGYQQKTSYKVLQKIRAYYGKQDHHAITFAEFYQYYGISSESPTKPQPQPQSTSESINNHSQHQKAASPPKLQSLPESE